MLINKFYKLYFFTHVSPVVEDKKCLNPENGRKLVLVSVDTEFFVEQNPFWEKIL